MTMGDEGGGLWGEFSMVGVAPDRSFGRERPLGRQEGREYVLLTRLNTPYIVMFGLYFLVVCYTVLVLLGWYLYYCNSFVI